MLTCTAEQLRNHLDELIFLARETREPVTITQDCYPDLVLVRADVLEERERVLRHRAAVLEAELSRLNGDPTYTIEQVRAMLREMYQSAPQSSEISKGRS